jgi:hypothetical protein
MSHMLSDGLDRFCMLDSRCHTWETVTLRGNHQAAVLSMVNAIHDTSTLRHGHAPELPSSPPPYSQLSPRATRGTTAQASLAIHAPLSMPQAPC